MADEQAILQLTVEVREAVASIEEVRAKYNAAVADMQAATKAGLDPASAEFAHLQGKAKEAGEELIAAGTNGRNAMVNLANATGQSTAGVKDLDAGIAVVRADVKKIGTEGPASFNLLSQGIDKTAAKLKTFGLGLVAGILISEFIPAVKDAASGLGDFIAQLQMGEQAVVSFGERTRSLAAAQEEVAQRVTRAEAERVKAQTGTALSLDEVAAAVARHRVALAAAEAAYDKARASANSLDEVEAARIARLAALTAAEHEYHDAISGRLALVDMDIARGKEVAAEINSQIEREGRLKDALAGNREAMLQRADDLVRVVAALKEEGEISAAVRARVTEDVKKLATEFKTFDEELPDGLRKLRAEFPFLTDEQEKAAAAAERFAKAQRDAASATREAAAAASGASRDVFGRELDPQVAQAEVEALRKRKAALEEETESGAASGETFEELARIKGQLAVAEGRLNEALNSGVRAWQGTEHAVQAAEVAIRRVSDLAPGLDNLASQIRTTEQAHDDAGEAAANHGSALNDQSRAAGEAARITEQLAGGTAQYTQDVKSADSAIAGLAASQDKFNRDGQILAETMKANAAGAGQFGDKVKTTEERLAEMTKRVEALQKAMEASFGKEILGSVDALAERLETRLIPLCNALKACLDSIEAGG